MKKLMTILVISGLTLMIFAQAPEKLSYQAVIRNSSGGLVNNHAVGLRISILQGSATGTAVYVETHTTTTNANGLATVVIGGGILVSGTFTGIDWSTSTYYLKTETDPEGGTSYSISGTSQLLSVPYALYSGAADGLKLPYNGAVSSAAPAFKLINNGLGEGIKSTVVSASKTGIIGEAPNQGILGNSTATSGAAYGVQGISASATGSGVTGYVTSITGLNYGVKGLCSSPEGCGVFGSAPFKGIKGEATAAGGITIGVEGRASSNTGIGVYGYSADIGIYGLATSGISTGVRGEANSTSGTTVGIKGVVKSASGFSGHFSGGKFYIEGNTGIGTETPGELLHVNNSSGRTSLRLSADAASLSEVQFYSAATYKGAIGYQNASDYLFIYQNGNVIFKNGRIGIQTVTNPTYAIELPNNSATGTGVARAYQWSTYSDGRVKSDRQPLAYGLNEVMQLQPVMYFHHNSALVNREIVMEDGGKPGIGFIAQDIYKIIPEVVNVPQDENADFWSMSYEKLTPVLVKAIQELKAENDKLKARLDRIEKSVISGSE